MISLWQKIQILALGLMLIFSTRYAAAQTPPLYNPVAAPFIPNTVMEPISREVRDRWVRDRLAPSLLSLRDLSNLLAHKAAAKPGLSFDEVVESMKLRANKLNIKSVGANPVWKEITAITSKPTPRVEIFSFCDALLVRELLDYSLESVIFMPCRIAVVEDAQGKIWLMMLDWNPDWLDAASNPNRLPDALRESARKLRQGLEEVLQAGANGDL